MDELKQYNFGFFLTRGLSLATWEKIGILDREIAIYKKLAEEYNSLYIFSYGGKGEKKYEALFPRNVTVLHRPFMVPVFLYVFIMPFIQRNTCRRLDVIKTNQMDGSIAAVLVKKMFHPKLVVRCGYEWLSYLESTNASFFKKMIAFNVETYAYSNADKVIISSEPAKHFIKERFGVEDTSITVIPNAINTTHFSPHRENRISRRIVFVGRIESVKNLESLIRSLQGLDAHLVVIGEGSLQEELKRVAKDVSVEVEWLGVVSQKELPSELNKSDIFVLPSFSEGNPKSLLEAMSCGLPCVGSAVPGIEAVIKNGVNGITCGTDVDSLRDAISILLKDEELKKKIGDNARKTIEEIYSLDTIFKKEVMLYDQILRYTK